MNDGCKDSAQKSSMVLLLLLFVKFIPAIATSLNTNLCEQMSKIYIKKMVAKYYLQQRPMESNRTRRYKYRNM